MRINEVVGQFLKQYRVEHNLTLDDVATASQRYGSGWSAATVSNIEKGGGKADSLPTIMILLSALNDLEDEDWAREQAEYSLTDEEVQHDSLVMADLLGGVTGKITISKSFAAPVDVIIGILNGGKAALGDGLTKEERSQAVDAHLAKIKKIIDLYASISYLPADKKAMDFFDTHIPSAAEKRAAKKVGLNPDLVAAWCYSAYGRTLDEEANARAGEGASPQKRGRATRELVEEMENALRLLKNNSASTMANHESNGGD